MTPSQLSHILQKYGVAFLRAGTVQKGYRNSSFAVQLQNGTWRNLILYKNEPAMLPKIIDANKVSSYLHAQDFAVRYPVDQRVLRLTSPKQTRYVSLYNYLPGHTIPWEAYTMRHIKLLGQTMSGMHAALSKSNLHLSQTVAGEYSTIFRRMQCYFQDKNVANALQRKLQLHVPGFQCEYFLRLLKSIEKLPNQQPLHMDFVRGNILFSGESESLNISGILDFEKTMAGPLICDFARTLAFLLVDCNLPEAKIRKYFLHSGYNKRGAATFQSIPLRRARHKDLLEALIDLYLLHDFYKFLRHNPYESLPQNHHFARTSNLLQRRAVIVPTK